MHINPYLYEKRRIYIDIYQIAWDYDISSKVLGLCFRDVDLIV